MSKNFWNNRYKNKDTGWDLGVISPPIKTYIDQLTDKNIFILIPGAGNSYEAEYLHKKKFKNVFIIDISELAIENFKKRVPNFPKEHIICGDFFELNKKFDVIIEQTFYCAINPKLRDTYVHKMNSLLNKNGKLVGLLFQFPLTEQVPPYGGSIKEYKKRFLPYFTIKTIETAHNSIISRKDKELFVIFQKKEKMSKTIILTNEQINLKIKRIAFQIYENNSTEKEVILAGITDNGYILAKKIHEILQTISAIKSTLCKVSIDKKNPLTGVTTDISSENYKNKSIVLVDDVLNSGSTLIYVIKHFLDVPLKQFKTAVLVNRNHKKYPVKADFKGISLSTSTQEHINVVFLNSESIAYLE